MVLVVVVVALAVGVDVGVGVLEILVGVDVHVVGGVVVVVGDWVDGGEGVVVHVEVVIVEDAEVGHGGIWLAGFGLWDGDDGRGSVDDVERGRGEGAEDGAGVGKGVLRASEPTAKLGLGRSHAWLVDAGPAATTGGTAASTRLPTGTAHLPQRGCTWGLRVLGPRRRRRPSQLRPPLSPP